MDSLGGGGADSLGAATGSIRLDASQAISSLNTFGQGLQNLQEQSTSGLTGLTGLAQAIDRNSQSFTMMGQNFAAVGGGVVLAFGGAVRAATGFEATLSGIAAVADLTSAEMGQLSDLALQLGADTSFGASEAALSMQTLAKAGVDVEDILNGAAASAIALAEAGGGDLVQSTEIMTAAMAAFNISGEDSIRVANALAGAANVSLADVSDLGIGLAQVGGVADAFGISLEETTAALAVLAEAGLSGSDAATSMKTSLLQLASPTDKQRQLMQDLGIEITNADGSFKSLTDIIGEVDTATQGMTESQRIATLEQLVGSDGVRFLTFMLDAQGEVLEDGRTAWEHFLEATSGGVQASEVAAKRLDNLRGDVEQLTGAIETISIRVGTVFIPMLRQAVQWLGSLAGAVASLPTPVLAAVSGVTLLGGVLALLAGGTLLLLPRLAETYLAVQQFRRWGGIPRVINGITVAMRGLTLAMVSNPLILAGIVAIGAAILAYKANFLGFGDAVRGVFSGIAGFIDRFKEAWDTFGKGIPGGRTWVGFWMTIEKVNASATTFSRILRSLAAGLRGIAGDNTPGWIESLADGLDRIAGVADDAVTAFRDVWDSFGRVTDIVTTAEGVFVRTSATVNTFSRVLFSLGAALDAIGLDRFGAFLASLGDTVQRLAESFTRWRDGGLDPVRAALVAITDVFPNLIGVTQGLFDAVTSVIAAFDAFMAGDWRTGFAELGNAAQSAWDAIRAGVGMLADWTLDVGVPTVTGWIVDAAGDMWGALKAAAGWAATIAGDLGAWALNTAAPVVGGWVADAAADIWGALKTAVGWAMLWAGELGAWALNTAAPVVGGWISDAADNAWDMLKKAAGWAGDVVGEIDEIRVDILDWAFEAATPLAVRLQRWLNGIAGGGGISGAGGVMGAVATGGRPAVRIDNVTVHILDWLISDVVPDMWAKITEAADAAWTLVAGNEDDVGPVNVKIGGFEVSGPEGGIWSAITTWIDAQMEITDEQLAKYESWGENVGGWVMEKVIAGIKAIFSSGGGAGGGGAAGSTSASNDFNDAIYAFFGGLFDGAWAVLEPELDALALSLKRDIEGWWNGFMPDLLSFDRSYMVSSGGAAQFGAVGDAFGIRSGLLGAVQDMLDGLQADLQAAADAFTEWWDGLWDFDLSIPDFDVTSFLPDVGFELSDIPGWDTAQATVQSFKNWLADPLGEDSAAPPPITTGPALGGTLYPRGRGIAPSPLADLREAQASHASSPLAGMVDALRADIATIRDTIASSTAEWGASLTAGMAAYATIGQTAFTALQTAATTPLVTLGTTVATSTTGILATFTTGFGGIPGVVAPPMATAGQAVLTQTTAMLTATQTNTAGMSAATGTHMEQVRSSIASKSQQAASGLSISMAGMRQGTALALAAMAVTASTQGAAMANALIAQAGRAVQGVAAQLGRLAGIVQGAGGAAIGAAQAVGANIGNALASGLRSALGAVAAAANALVAQADRAIRAAAQIRSPSRVFMALGELLGLGFSTGISNLRPEVASVASGMVGELTGIIGSGIAMLNRVLASVVLPDTSWLTSGKQIFTTGDRDAITKYFQSMWDGMDMDWGNDFIGHISDWAAGGKLGSISSAVQAIGRDLADDLKVDLSDYAGMVNRTTFDMIRSAFTGAELSMRPNMPTPSPYQSAPAYVDNRHSVTFARGSIVQQPGEDGEALARRVIDALTDGYVATGKV